MRNKLTASNVSLPRCATCDKVILIQSGISEIHYIQLLVYVSRVGGKQPAESRCGHQSAPSPSLKFHLVSAVTTMDAARPCVVPTDNARDTSLSNVSCTYRSLHRHPNDERLPCPCAAPTFYRVSDIPQNGSTHHRKDHQSIVKCTFDLCKFRGTKLCVLELWRYRTSINVSDMMQSAGRIQSNGRLVGRYTAALRPRGRSGVQYRAKRFGARQYY